MGYKPGTYRVFEIMHNQGQPHEQLVARFWIDDNQFHILEDYNHILSDALPEGIFNASHERLLNQLANSGYYKIISSKEANQGEHEDLIEDLDIGDVEPDSEYLMYTQNEEPQTMQMYGEVAILNGKKLTDEELQQTMDKVKSGEISMHPY